MSSIQKKTELESSQRSGLHSPIVTATSEQIQRAAEIIKADGICAFPTETVYGLGGNALSEKAVRLIYKLKERPPSNPLIVHVAGWSEVHSLVTEIPDIARDLIDRFWPGPLTLIFKKSEIIPNIVSAHLPTVAIRAPKHPVAQALLKAAGVPICAPSANRSEGVSPTTALHVHESLPSLAFILDGGPCTFGIESTVLDLTAPCPTLLRPGVTSARELKAIIPDLILPSVRDSISAELPRASPGMMARHYAPTTPLLLCDRIDKNILRSFTGPVGVMTFSQPQISVREFDVVEIMSKEPKQYAADLYATLHRLEKASLLCILVETPPKEEDWFAIYDRLYRAQTR